MVEGINKIGENGGRFFLQREGKILVFIFAFHLISNSGLVEQIMNNMPRPVCYFLVALDLKKGLWFAWAQHY